MSDTIKAMTKKQQEHLFDVPAMYKGIIEHAYTNPMTPKKKIKAKCLECSCYQRVEVTNCRAETCPLWTFRPYQATDIDIDIVEDNDLCSPAAPAAPGTREAMPLD